MADNTVSETTTVRTITINVCKINTAVKLQVQHGQHFFNTELQKFHLQKSYKGENP